MAKKIKYIVWDWNGTLIDDVECAVRTINILLKERQMSLIDQTQYRDLFCFPVADYYRKIGFDVNSPEFPKVAERFIELYDEHYASCTLHQGARETMQAFQEQGIRQIILSATEKNNLLKQVANFGMNDEVDAVLGIDDIYAGSKVYLATRWMKENDIDPKEVLFVGDTLHDYEVASQNGASCILLSKGHQSRTTLETTGMPIVEDHAQIAEYVAGYSF